MEAISRLLARLVQPIDGLLLLGLLALAATGLTVLYSASGESPDRIAAHVRNLSLALAAMWLVANIPPQQLMRLAVPLYIGGLLLLVAVAVAGDTRLGAKRWLNIGVTSIQPSELMKIALPLMLAWFFHRHEATLRWPHFIVAGLLLAVPAALIFEQPDLGTALLISASGFFVLFLAGLDWRLLAGLAIAGAGGAYLVTHWDLCTLVFREYQCRRVATMIDPMQDPLGAGYHIIQSTIAIGSGGMSGKGWLKGTQGHLDFLPEPTTDFIFAVYGEEFGLLGNLLLLMLYLFVIARGLLIAASASSLFGRLLAGAITLTFFTYAFVNMGMVSGLLPVVGVPLPLLSYGGTAMVTMMVGFGILMSVARHKKLVVS